MSSKRHCTVDNYYGFYPPMGGYGGGSNGCSYGGLGSGSGFNFSYILILLLIALQFGRRRDLPMVDRCSDGVVSDPGIGGGFLGENRGLIDNSVLFILAFYLLVCGCCIGGGGCGGNAGCGCGRRFF